MQRQGEEKKEPLAMNISHAIREMCIYIRVYICLFIASKLSVDETM